jgi:uncharacterized membrane protein
MARISDDEFVFIVLFSAFVLQPEKVLPVILMSANRKMPVNYLIVS